MLFSLNKANELEEFCGMQGFRRLSISIRLMLYGTAVRNVLKQMSLSIRPNFPERMPLQKFQELWKRSAEWVRERCLFPSLDEIAWLFNIRGADIPFNPVSIAYAYVSDDKKIIFIDKEKLSPDVVEYFRDNGIEIRV